MSDYDDGFEDYVKTTNDPGNILIAVTLIFCLASNFMMPCFVSVGRRFQKRRSLLRESSTDDTEPHQDNEDEEQEQPQEQEESDNSAQVLPEDDMKSVSSSEEYHSCEASCDDDQSSLSASEKKSYHVRDLMSSGLFSSPLVVENTNVNSVTPTDEESSASVLMSLPDFSSPTIRNLEDYPSDLSGGRSTVSSDRPSSNITVRSETSSTSLLDAGLFVPLKRRRGGRFRRRRGVEERRRLQHLEVLESKRNLEARLGQQKVATERDDGVAASEPWRPSNNDNLRAHSLKANSEPSRLRSRAGLSNCNGSDPSSLRSFVIDDLAPEDAPDADSNNNNGGVAETLAIEDVDLCCGEHAWWRPSMVARAWDDLLDLMDWDREWKRLVQLALPFSLSAVIEGIFELVVIALIGHYIGTDSLAAFATVNLLVGLSSEFVGGVCDVITVLCPHAIGAGNYFLAGQYVQISVILYAVAMIPIILLWFFATRPTMIWFGFNEQTAQIAQDYAIVIVFEDLVEGIHDVYLNFLSVIDRELWATAISIVEEFLSAIIVLCCVLTRDTTLTQVGVIYLSTALFFTVFDLVYTIRMGWVQQYMKGIVGEFGLKNRYAVLKTLKTAAPLAIGGLISYGEWEVLAIFAGSLGPAEVATWGILGSLWESIESFSEGVADAGEIRCAHHLGAGRPIRAKESAYKCTLLGFFSSALFTSVVFILGEDMAHWFTPDPTLQQMIIEILPLVGIGNITLTAGTISWSLVGSQGRYRLGTAVSVAASWGVTMPLAALMTYAFNLNLQGITSAVVFGYSVSGTTLMYILITSDWAKLSRKIEEDNVAREESEESLSSNSLGSSSSSSSSHSLSTKE